MSRGEPAPDNDGWVEVSQMLRDARLTAGLGYVGLARLMLEPGCDPKRLNVKRQSIWHLENNPGYKGPWASTIEDIAASLNIKVTFDGTRWSWHGNDDGCA